MMKYYILAGVILVLGIGIFFYTRTSEKIINYPSRGENIVAFGDSLISGVGATDGKDFVSLLSIKIERETGKKIVNLGVPGNTTKDGLARVSEIARYNPKVVLVLLGGNDYLRKVSQAETFSNLEKIITQIQSTGAVVVLLGIQGGIFSDPYESQFQTLSKKMGTLYVPNMLSGLVGDSRYMSDAVHPNDAGYVKIAEKVYPILEKVIK